jgi:hypothetical protein
VRFLVSTGVRQFIDLGSGIPTVGNVHEVAHEIDPDIRVVYVDNDPVALAHSRAMLHDNRNAVMIPGDLRQPAEVLADRTLRATLDLYQPVAILLVAVLHFITDDQNPENIVAGYVAASAPGSYVAISHLGLEQLSAGGREALAMYVRSGNPVVARTREQVTELFGDLTLVKPGVVPLGMWRPDSPEDVPSDAEVLPGHCGIGRKD